MLGGVDDELADGESQPRLVWEGVEQGAASRANGDYQIIELLGRGGMGEVYRAWQPSVGRLVAVKVLSSSSAMPGAHARFQNEARVLGLLQHPNIMPVHDLGKDADGRSFYAMKLVKGRTLQQVLNDLRRGDAQAVKQYPLAALLTVFEKACDALSFAHSQGVLHRDLKPDNIMVGEFGEVLVLDWGLARVTGIDLDESSGETMPDIMMGMTMDGDVLGTPQFMSPEQAAGQHASLDERSDLFSLGGVLYAILTLHPPVEGDDVKAVLERVREGAITPPSLHGTEAARINSGRLKPGIVSTKPEPLSLPHCPGGRVPAALSAVVMKALQVDLARRYPSVAALQADVVAYQRGFATSAERAGAWRQLQLLTLRHKAASAALLVLVIFSVGFVLKLLESEREAQQSAREANEAKIVAQEKGEAERRARARAQLSLAEAAYRAHDSPTMLAALDGVPNDLRDTKWRYLQLRSDNSAHSFPDAEHCSFMGAAPHPTRPGLFAAVASSTGDFMFLDAVTGQKIGGFAATPQQRQIRYSSRALAFSPDGTRLLSGRPEPGGAVVYDVATGQALGKWPNTSIMSASFSLDSTHVLLVQFSFVLSVHDAATGAKLWEKPQISRAIYLPSGDVVAGYGGQIRLLNGATGDTRRKILALTARAHSLAVSPDGNVLFMGCDDGWVRACNMADSTMIFQVALTETAHDVYVTLSGDGKRLIAAADLESGGRVVHMLNASTGRTMQTLMGGTGAISSISMHPLSGDVLISGPETRSWTSRSFPVAERVIFANDVSSAFWGASDRLINLNSLLTLGSSDQPVATALPLPELGQDEGLWRADAAGEWAAFVKGWSGKESQPSTLYAVHREGDTFKLTATAPWRKSVAALRLSADGTRLMIKDLRSIIEVFDTQTCKRVCECETVGLSFDIPPIWLSPRYLAGLANKPQLDLIVWDTDTGKVVRRTTNPTRMDALACSADGCILAEGGEDKRVRLRDASTLEIKQEFRAHDAAITALAFHPTKPLLATASSDRSVRLWNLTDGTIAQEIAPSHEAVVRLLFSPEGDVLACFDHAHFAHFIRVDAGH
jgi:serine/threonine protein kinase/WD40 repeat protein